MTSFRSWLPAIRPVAQFAGRLSALHVVWSGSVLSEIAFTLATSDVTTTAQFRSQSQTSHLLRVCRQIAFEIIRRAFGRSVPALTYELHACALRTMVDKTRPLRLGREEHRNYGYKLGEPHIRVMRVYELYPINLNGLHAVTEVFNKILVSELVESWF